MSFIIFPFFHSGVSRNPECSESPCRLSAEGSESSGCTAPDTERHRVTETDGLRITDNNGEADVEWRSSITEADQELRPEERYSS